MPVEVHWRLARDIAPGGGYAPSAGTAVVLAGVLPACLLFSNSAGCSFLISSQHRSCLGACQHGGGKCPTSIRHLILHISCVNTLHAVFLIIDLA